MNLRKVVSKFPVLPTWTHYYLPLAFVITIMSGLVYVAIQGNMRQSANDPQIQISEDIALSLAAGQDSSQIIPNYSIDISKTLSNFVILYDDSGKVVASTASLDEKVPEIPQGVLDEAKAHGQNRITWMPKEGVRAAVVITRYQDKASGYVLVGRSLREVEKRVARLTKTIALAWTVSIVGSLFIVLLLEKLSGVKKK